MDFFPPHMIANAANFHTFSYPAICFLKLISCIEVNCPASNSVVSVREQWVNGKKVCKEKRLPVKNGTIESLNAIKEKN